MNEFKLTIEAPALTDAIKALASAIGQINTAAEPAKPKKERATKTAAAPAEPTAEAPAQQTPPPAPAPAPAPIQQTPAPVQQPVSTPAPVQQAPIAVPTPPPAPVALAPAPAPMQQPAAPVQQPPVSQFVQPKTYTAEEIGRAGSLLLEQGKMNDLAQLLAAFGVQSINQLAPEQYPAFAASMRGLGVNV